jgi:hypothetical protein
LNGLFENYSERSLTFKTDRCAAMSGLEKRIANAFECQSTYGIFERYLHRNLLWHASESKVEDIAYDDETHVPSWSWMAYHGAIRFEDIHFGEVDWIEGLRLVGNTLLAEDVGIFWNCSMRPYGDRYIIVDVSKRKGVGGIRYDVEDGENLRKERCVVVGRRKDYEPEIYYILVVRSTGRDGEYRRVGVGEIQSDYLLRSSGRYHARVV